MVTKPTLQTHTHSGVRRLSPLPESGILPPMSDEGSGSALARRGLALFRAGRDAAAIPALGQAIALQPEGRETRRVLAAALWRSGRREDALATLRDAVLVAPDDASTWQHLGSALLALDCPEQAAWALAEAHLLDPRLPGLARSLERIPAALLEAPGDLARRLDFAADPAELAGDLRRVGVLATGVLQRAVPRAATARLVVGGLGQMAPELGLAALLKWLCEGTVAVRVALAEVALRLAGGVRSGDGELLARVLGDPEPAVATAAAAAVEQVLSGTTPAVALGLVQAVWATAPEHPARAGVTAWLSTAAWTGGPGAEALLSWALAAGPTELVAAVAAALTAAAEEDLPLRLYSHGTAEQRRQAVELFVALGSGDLLAVALWDDDSDLRSAAALALGRLGQGAGPLRERLEAEPDGAVKHVMQAALRRLAPAESAEEQG